MITIHKANVTDAPEIKKLLYKTWISTYLGIYTRDAIDKITSDWHAIPLLEKQILDPARIFLVAKEGDKIVGICNTAIFDDKENKINIQRLYVDPEYQRREIGTALMNKATKAFPQANKADLEIEKQNKKAVSFYRKNGYTVISEKVFVIQNIQMPCLIMEKTL